MKKLTNVNPKDLGEAVTLLKASREGKTVSLAAGGSDVLRMIKHGLIAPDRLINLKSVAGLDRIDTDAKGVRIGSMVTLSALSSAPVITSQYAALAQAAALVASPQIRNVGTLGGNIAQRPWCWYYRGPLFACLRKGGGKCFAVNGENEHHAILGGGPCFIVHPSDTATALVALNASFRIVGAGGERTVPASSFFVPPGKDIRRENVLGPDDILAEIRLPAVARTRKSAFAKVMDRGTWDHAVVNVACVLEVADGVCKDARVVLGGVAPVPWAAPAAEKMLAGQRVTPEIAENAAEAAVAGARPLTKNAHKVKIAKALVRRTLLSLSQT